MVMGHQHVNEVGPGHIGIGPEKKARLTPADYVYRIATLVAVAFLLATVF